MILTYRFNRRVKVTVDRLQKVIVIKIQDKLLKVFKPIHVEHSRVLLFSILSFPNILFLILLWFSTRSYLVLLHICHLHVQRFHPTLDWWDAFIQNVLYLLTVEKSGWYLYSPVFWTSTNSWLPQVRWMQKPGSTSSEGALSFLDTLYPLGGVRQFQWECYNATHLSSAERCFFKQQQKMYSKKSQQKTK